MDAVDLAKRLMAVNTASPVTDPEVFELLQSFLAEEGIEAEICDFDGVKNIVAECGGSGTSICFNGHLDVVEPGSGWSVTDPFEPVVKDGWLYGRGAADMKASFAAQVMAFVDLCRDETFEGHVTLMGVGDEEVGGFKGTQQLIEEYNGYDYALIGEPTGMDLQIGVRGVKWINLYFKGESGHSSRPEDTYNVNEDLPRILEALNSMEMTYEPDPLLPGPTAPVTQVETSGPHNSFPGEVHVGLDVRPLPSQSLETIKQDVHDALADVDVEYEMNVIDHGEAFKEYGLWGRPFDVHIPQLVEVPWLV
ncbi:MAG: M20/M25/M40 family metallo-hydrolase, partial [Candidatus Nanohaloarchaea archaeon]|nr:M20/M25/M40 family metallo-hydrolase [Candidatus Nanohaloarchaea archaeon]